MPMSGLLFLLQRYKEMSMGSLRRLYICISLSCRWTLSFWLVWVGSWWSPALSWPQWVFIPGLAYPPHWSSFRSFPSWCSPWELTTSSSLFWSTRYCISMCAINVQWCHFFNMVEFLLSYSSCLPERCAEASRDARGADRACPWKRGSQHAPVQSF